MSSVFEFVAEVRDRSGRSGARALRREGKIPAVIYGGNAAPQLLALDHNEIIKHLSHEAVYSHVLDIIVDGKTEQVILKDIKRHPAKAKVLHMDFMRVSATEKLRVNVPLHFLNEEFAVGAKKGGVIMHNLVDVEVSCLPSDLPTYFEVDLENVDVGESVHLSDIRLPQGVEICVLSQGQDHDLPVASILVGKTDTVDDEEAPDLPEEETEE